MKKAKSEAEIAEAARAWGRLRLLVLAVQEARNSFRCELEEAEEHDYATGYSHPGSLPCWKAREWNYEHEPMDASEWCASCLARHRWHLALVAIKRMHGGRLRRLQRWSVAPAAEIAARAECPSCEGDGFGPMASNCATCGGGGTIAARS